MPSYIEAGALLMELNDTDIFDTYNDYSMVFDTIDNFPAADVAPVRHGHWDTISDSDMSKTVTCSACNKMFHFTKKGQLNIDMMPYCPWCGAKMDEKE